MHITVRRFPAAPFALAASVLAAVLMLATPLSASAHDGLLTSDPAADTTVATLPTELTLTFSATLIDGEGATEVVVTDAAGNSVTDGPATVDGATVTQPLVSKADAGVYRVIWKVVSSDGHPTSGEFGFSVSTGTAGEIPPAADPTTEPEEAVTTEPTAPAVVDDPNMTSGFSVSAPWIIGAAVVLLIAALIIFMVVRNRRGSSSRSDSDDSAER